MRTILLILMLLKPIIGFSQDTIRLTNNDSILMIKLAENLQKIDSLQRLMDSLDKRSDSIYLSLTNNEPVNPIFVNFNQFSETELKLIFTQNGMSFD